MEEKNLFEDITELSEGLAKKYGFKWISKQSLENPGCHPISIQPKLYQRSIFTSKRPKQEEKKQARIYQIEDGTEQARQVTEIELESILDERELRIISYNKVLQEIPFEITLYPQENKKTLSNLEEIEKFLEQEQEYWKKLRENLVNGKEFVSAHQQHYDAVSAELKQAHESRLKNDKTSYESYVRRVHNFLKSGKTNGARNNSHYPLVCSEAKIGSFILSEDQKDPTRAVAAYDYLVQDMINSSFFQNNNSYNTQNQDYLAGLIDSYLFLEGEKSRLNGFQEEAGKVQAGLASELNETVRDFKNQTEAHKKEYIQLSNEITEWHLKSDAEFVEFMNSKETHYQDEKEKFEKDISNLKDAYEKQLQLKAPTKHWAEQEDKYTKNARLWVILASFSGIVLIAILFLILIAADLPFLEGQKWTPNTVKGSLLILSLVSVGAYVVNIFVKLALSSHHLARDAAERLQLSYYYMSLIENGAVEEVDRNIILQALFSRSETGLFKNEGGPTMPIDLKAINKVNSDK